MCCRHATCLIAEHNIQCMYGSLQASAGSLPCTFTRRGALAQGMSGPALLAGGLEGQLQEEDPLHGLDHLEAEPLPFNPRASVS